MPYLTVRGINYICAEVSLISDYLHLAGSLLCLKCLNLIEDSNKFMLHSYVYIYISITHIHMYIGTYYT